MKIRTKRAIMCLASILVFSTISSNVNLYVPSVNAKEHHVKKTNKSKKVSKKKSTTKTTFNKIYSNSEVEQIIKQKFTNFMNSLRVSNGHQAWITNSKFSKLAEERSNVVLNMSESSLINVSLVTHDGSNPGKSVSAAYVDGFEMGIFPDDPSISNNISEYNYHRTFLPSQIHYSDIIDIENGIENQLSGVARNNSLYNDPSTNAILGNTGNGYNYAGIGVKIGQDETRPTDKRFSVTVISSDNNY